MNNKEKKKKLTFKMIMAKEHQLFVMRKKNENCSNERKKNAIRRTRRIKHLFQ